MKGLKNPMGDSRTCPISPMQNTVTMMKGNVIRAVLTTWIITVHGGVNFDQYFASGGSKRTSSWDHDVGAGNLFAKMNSRVDREVGIESGQQADAPRHKVAVPPCEIVELGENEFGIMLILGVSQENADNNKVAGKMKAQNFMESV